jgi:fumarylacetoacetase
MPQLDETHDPKRQSWVNSANGHPDFPIQNLPIGIFSPPGGTDRRGGIAIGDIILDLGAAAEAEQSTGANRQGCVGSAVTMSAAPAYGSAAPWDRVSRLHYRPPIGSTK